MYLKNYKIKKNKVSFTELKNKGTIMILWFKKKDNYKKNMTDWIY